MASVMMAVATAGWWRSPAPGPSTLGSTWRSMMRDGRRRRSARAACTYSLLRSTRVEPRTVRAYCTQPEMRDGEDQHARSAIVVVRVAGSSARPTPAISSATRMGGKRQHARRRTRMRKAVDASRRRKPPSRPSDTPSTQRQQHRGDAHHQRDARAVDDGREDVAALVVGAQQVFAQNLRRSRRAAGAASPSSSVARSKGLCGDDPVRRTPRRTRQTSAIECRADGHGRGTEAVADVAVEPAGDGCFEVIKPGRPKRKGGPSGRTWRREVGVVFVVEGKRNGPARRGPWSGRRRSGERDQGDAHPLEVHEVVGQLHQLDLLAHAPGQRLLVQRQRGRCRPRGWLEGFLDQLVALGLVGLGLDLLDPLVQLRGCW